MKKKLVWDNTGERLYETGVSKGVLYPIQPGGVYTKGVAWNGLTAVTESPSGAEATGLYADNIKYLNLILVERSKLIWRLMSLQNVTVQLKWLREFMQDSRVEKCLVSHTPPSLVMMWIQMTMDMRFILYMDAWLRHQKKAMSL